MTRIPHRCPVCFGTGQVQWPPGASAEPSGITFWSTGVGPWPCQPCLGAGIIWDPAEVEQDGKGAQEDVEQKDGST
jgi:hypothetical protein